MRTLRTLRPRRALPRPALPATALLVGALLAGSAPTLATGPTTWHVGPGTTASRGLPSAGGSGSCANPDTTDLQVAVDGSGPGDTIVLCDGTHDGQTARIQGPTHDGLTLVAETPWGATLLAPDVGVEGGLVEIVGADGVTVQHLRFRQRATCQEAPFAAIMVADARGVDVRANRVVGGDPQDECAFEFGILADDSTGRVRYNRVRNWGFYGIHAAFTGTGTGRIRLIGNSLAFAPTVVPASWNARFGLGADNHSATASVLIARNVVTVDPGIRGTRTNPALLFGIAIDSDRLIVRENRVTDASIALTVEGQTQVLVEGNRVRGMLRDCVGTPDQTWRDNDGRPARSDPVGICTLPS
jgi:hypothetical protein